MDAFDADVLIYAAAPGHPLGTPVLALFPEESPNDAGIFAGVGSTLLLPEVLTKPTRDGTDDEVAAVAALLARLDLRPVDEAIALLAVALGASYGLRSADAVHLATALSAGADRFITNNRRDFSQSIEEVSVTYPTDLT
ncbi:MAG: type II toxin-antitoxin system VapC family toxin [Acidimicrobiales bacterium]